jgi:uncharacterized protein with PIN domain
LNEKKGLKISITTKKLEEGEGRMKKEMKRCPRCRKKDTLHDISSEMIQINPFTCRSYSGTECHSGTIRRTYSRYSRKEYGKGI